MEDELDFFGLGDDAAAAFVLATQTPLPLVELCHTAVVAGCPAVFAALMQAETTPGGSGSGDGLLLPEELAVEVVATMTARRLWSNELLAFALRRVYDREVVLSTQPRLTRVAELLGDARLTANLRRVHLTSMTLGGSTLLTLHGLPLLGELRLEKVLAGGLSVADCPLLRHIDVQSLNARKRSVEIRGCTALESLELHGDLDLTCLSRVVNECADLRRLRCSSPVSDLFEIRLESREARLEELSIQSSVEVISLSGGCPRLTSLDLSNCADLQLVHISEATALTNLCLKSINLPHRSRHEDAKIARAAAGGVDLQQQEPARIRIENATSLVEVECDDVAALYVDSVLEHLSESIRNIRLSSGPCIEAVGLRAADVARLLQRAGRRSPLRSLTSLILQLNNDDIDDFELTDDRALPALEKLSLIGRSIRNVRVALHSLNTIQLETSSWWQFDASNVHDGRVSLTSPLKRGRLQTLILRGVLARELDLACPTAQSLSIWGTHVPPGLDLAAALPRLVSVQYRVDDFLDGEAQRLFGHILYRYPSRS